MGFYKNLKGEDIAIDTTKTSECPVSRITPDIQWLHGQFQSHRISAKSGAPLYGTDSRRWPAWWAHAVEVCTIASREANAIIGIKE